MVQPELKGGYLFDIQGFSVHDGPGCRTLIFFRNCSLNCAWCSNPEGISPFPEPLYHVSKCTFDSLCADACLKNAITINDNALSIDRDLCQECRTYECADACCTGALKIAGYAISVKELYRIIVRDRKYWGLNGGITLTGGEPFLQPEFAVQVLKKCYDSYIHTVAETCGNYPWKNIEGSLEYLDWIMYDIKHIDGAKHKKMTGMGNTTILDNAMRLAREFKGRLVFRMPVISGFNDDTAHIRQVSDFLHSTGRDEINILPLHHFGREKYKLLGKDYYTADFSGPGPARMQEIKEIFGSRDIKCYSGSDTPF
jgi:pyruvate formate lyase activating enzyme